MPQPKTFIHFRQFKSTFFTRHIRIHSSWCIVLGQLWMRLSSSVGCKLPWHPAWLPSPSQHSINIWGFNSKPSAVGPNKPFLTYFPNLVGKNPPQPQLILCSFALILPSLSPPPLFASLGFPIMKCPPSSTSLLFIYLLKSYLFTYLFVQQK